MNPMKHITIVGVGALGSHLCTFLRNEEIQMQVVDFDRVESKNLQSQAYTKLGSGKLKTEALKSAMQGFWGLRLKTVPHRLTKDNVEALLRGNDLVVDCLDNGASRRLVQDFCKDASIPCLHGALAPNGEYGRVAWSENFKIDDEAGVGGATCENGEFLPFICIVSAYLARSVQIYLRDSKQVGFEISPTSVFST